MARKKRTTNKKKCCSRKRSAQQVYHSFVNLKNSSSALRKNLIQKDRALLRAICTCSKGILSGQFKLPKVQVGKLEKHKVKLRTLAYGKSVASKKKVLQKGGFLGALLGAIVPALGSLVSGLIPRR